MAKGEVDLVIRAKNEATKNLDAVNKALKSLADQQTIVGDSAGQMDGQLGKLGVQLAQLQTNAQNLKSLASVQDVLDGATQALIRQRAATAGSGQEYDALIASQKDLAAQSKKMADSVTTAAGEFAKQDKALKTAKTTLSDLTRENGKLDTQERNLEKSIVRAAAALDKQNTALDVAKAKQLEKAQVVAESAKATKVEINSLDAANRTLKRREEALAAAIQKEKDLAATLTKVKQSIADGAAASAKMVAALTDQVAKTAAAKDALAAFDVQAKSLGQTERKIATEMAKAAAEATKQADALKTVEEEYRQIQDVADQAKAAVAGQSTANTQAGNTAAKAAFQVAAFAAKLAVLKRDASSKGKTSVSIVDAAGIEAADATLKKMSVTINAAGDEATRASVSAKEMETAIRGVGDAKGNLEGIGKAIKSQQAAVTSSSETWKIAEAEVRRLARAIKAADEPSLELAAAFGKSQAAAKMAKDEFVRQKAAAESIGASLKAAGIGAGNLASAEAALGPRIKAANDLMEQGKRSAKGLGDGLGDAGRGANEATPPVNRLQTALSGLVNVSARVGKATNPLRSFTGQITSMVAAAAGLYGIKRQLEGIYEAGSDLASSRAKFTTAFGGVAEGTAELEYAREVAINLKLPLETLTKGYADLALSAKGTSMEGQGIRNVFEGMAQTARVNQSSAAELEGVFKALTQIMSKGKVQAEELRGQLGDRLPGALQIMADGLQISMKQLDKMMEKGELTRETLLAMSAEASRRVGPALTEALATPAAKLADFQNRMTVFKETVAESGFLDAVADAFERLAEALSTPEALDAAREIGVALGDIVTWAADLVASGDLVAIGESIVAIGVAWVSVQIVSLVAGLAAFAKGVGVLAAAFFGLDIALSPILLGLGLLSIAVAAVAALFGSWKLAQWAYDNFPAFAEGILRIKKAALDTFDGLVQGVESMGPMLKNSFTGILDWIVSKWYNTLNEILGFMPALTKALGLGNFSGAIASKAAAANAKVVKNQKETADELDKINAKYTAKAAKREKDLQDQLAKYRADQLAKTESEIDGWAKAGDKPKGGKGGVGLNLITDPGGPDRLKADQDEAKAEAAAKAAAKKALALQKSVADQMYAIRSQLEKKSAKDVDEMVAAVPAKYAKLYAQLKQLGKDQTSDEWKTVDALVVQEQQIIRNAEAKKAATAAAKLARKEELAESKRRKEAMEQVNTLLRTRKNIQEQIDRAKKDGDVTTVETLKARLAEVTIESEKAINGMLDFWYKVGGPEADAAISKLETMRLTLTKVKDDAILTGANIGNAFTGNVSSGINSFVDKLVETGDVIGSLKESFRAFAVDFLAQIAKMIVQQMIFNAISGAMGGPGAGASAGSVGGMIAGMFHNGGRVGSGNQTRSGVNPAVFANAVRYHGGGVAGLQSNEVPAILKAGETVRTQEQEKALSNRQSATSAAPPQVDVKVVNTLDAGSFISAGVEDVAGQKAILNFMRANKNSVRGALGV